MNYPQPSFTVYVDVTNPGQVIACCGLLELAHRLWPGAEGWFNRPQFLVAVPGQPSDNALVSLFRSLTGSEVSGLSEAELKERDALESQSRELKKKGERLPPNLEKRRRELGERAREGVIWLGKPFHLTLDWWQTSDEEAVPKTWAGRQELHRIARAAQDALAGVSELAKLLDYGCVLREPREYRKKKSDDRKAVEPFYFDARRFAHSLDVGFSLDVQDAETIAHPAVELLCLIGLQRFRPVATSNEKWSFDYWIWSMPLSAPVAAAVFSGVSSVPGRRTYRFRLRFRDDQKRYKAFSMAIPTGGDA